MQKQEEKKDDDDGHGHDDHTLPTITMMPPPKAASKMAVVGRRCWWWWMRRAVRGRRFLRVWCRTQCFSAMAADVRARDGEFKRDARLVGAMETPCSLAEQTLVRPGANAGDLSCELFWDCHKKRTGFSALLNKSGQGLMVVGRGAIKKLERARKEGRVLVRARKTPSMHLIAQTLAGDGGASFVLYI